MRAGMPIYLRDSTRRFLIMNAKGEYFGPGGWVENIHEARQFSPEHAAEMLKVFPRAALISAIIRGLVDRRHSTVRSGEERRHEERRSGIERRHPQASVEEREQEVALA